MKTDTELKKEENILILLKSIKNKNGFISDADVVKIASETRESVATVYGVATFYSFLNVKVKGHHIIKICRSLPCHMKAMENIRTKLSELLGIQPGETTGDGRFTLELTNCIGACDMAPAMLINDDLHGNLRVEHLNRILEAYK